MDNKYVIYEIVKTRSYCGDYRLLRGESWRNVM